MNLLNWISKKFKKVLPAAQPDEPTSQRVEKTYKTFDERYEDTGVFQYDSEGFSISTEKFTETIKWQDITKLNVYKVDMLTIDQIEMEIEYNNGADGIRITEDLNSPQRVPATSPSITTGERLGTLRQRLHSQVFPFTLGLSHSLKKMWG